MTTPPPTDAHDPAQDEPGDQPGGQEYILTVSYDPPGAVEPLFGLSEDTLLQVMELTLSRVGVRESAEISLLVTDDAGIQKLNREYRGLDEPTDVLSFPLLDAPLVDAPAEQLWLAMERSESVEEDNTGDEAGNGANRSPGTQHAPEGLSVVFIENDASETDMLDGGQDRADEATEETEETEETEDDDDDLDDEEAPDEQDELDLSWPTHLGDIALARETVIRQASRAGHSVAWECAYLFAHGILHLVGYDDQTDAGYQAMVAHQEAILAELAIQK